MSLPYLPPVSGNTEKIWCVRIPYNCLWELSILISFLISFLCSGSESGDSPTIDHFDFNIITQNLPYIRELHITYG